MTAINRTVAPTLEPVTLDEVKRQARIVIAAEDQLLESQYIPTARERCEDYLAQAFVTQTWELAIDRWPSASVHNPLRSISLPRAPVQSVSSVVYAASDGTSTTMASTDYQVDIKSKPGRVAPSRNTYWPTLSYGTLNPVVVTFKAGYGGASAASDASLAVAAVPLKAKQAMIVYAAHLYRTRDIDAAMPAEVTGLLDLCSFGTYRYPSPDAT